MELRRTKEGMIIDNRRNKEEETELSVNAQEEEVRRMTQFISKREPSAAVRRLSGRSNVVNSQADLSLCVQELKFWPDIEIN